MGRRPVLRPDFRSTGLLASEFCGTFNDQEEYQIELIYGASMKAMTNHLTIRHLRMVVAIVDEGNLVRASKQLNMTQSAITKALQEAEVLTRTRLFDRNHRSVIEARLGKHSEKPQIAYDDFARRVAPDAPKLDLFSRQTRPGGWVAFGNQKGMLDARD